LRGGRIGGKGRGGEKGVERGEEGLEGEDFPGKFGKPLDRQIRQGPPSPKPETATRSGAITYPLPPPCLRPYVWV